jgi:hypothetical protein
MTGSHKANLVHTSEHALGIHWVARLQFAAFDPLPYGILDLLISRGSVLAGVRHVVQINLNSGEL